MDEPREMARAVVRARFEELVANRALVLHLPTLVIARAKTYYAEGRGGVTEPVLEMEEGHSFVASDSARFVELDAQAEAFYRNMLVGLRAVVEMAAKAAPAVGAEKGLKIAIAALRAQLRELQKGDDEG